jgi:hypothetical protein
MAADEAEMMFERMIDRVQRRTEAAAKARVLKLTERMRAGLPRGIEAEAAPEGVRLSGRDLRRRFVLDAALRWLPLGSARDRRLS